MFTRENGGNFFEFYEKSRLDGLLKLEVAIDNINEHYMNIEMIGRLLRSRLLDFLLNEIYIYVFQLSRVPRIPYGQTWQQKVIGKSSETYTNNSISGDNNRRLLGSRRESHAHTSILMRQRKLVHLLLVSIASNH